MGSPPPRGKRRHYFPLGKLCASAAVEPMKSAEQSLRIPVDHEEQEVSLARVPDQMTRNQGVSRDKESPNQQRAGRRLQTRFH
jgi:hypothetical protein